MCLLMEGKAGECLMASDTLDKVRELQHKLYWAAKQSPSRRFHALYDKVHRMDVLWRAWQEVAAKGLEMNDTLNRACWSG